MARKSRPSALVLLLASLPFLPQSVGPVLGENTPSGEDAVLTAMVQELDRSMNLQLEDLEKPYFIQFSADDTMTYSLSASYGALTSRQQNRRRTFASRVRVGDMALDNTNFVGGGPAGGRGSLPLDDDLVSLRQAIWSATDDDYKAAVEALTRKRAYLEQKKIEDRPADFTPTEPVKYLDPPAALTFEEAAWAERLRTVSARFKNFPTIQDSAVMMIVAAGTDYTVNTEGTRLRIGDTAVLLSLQAELQAADGMRLSDDRQFGAYKPEDLPSTEALLGEVDALCSGLTAVADAPVLDEYTGPVLFDDKAAPQLFASLLAPGLAGQPEPIGMERSSDDTSLEAKIGKHVLPQGFTAYDDPTVKFIGSDMLFGWYEYDDEAVPARRVDLVAEGKLLTLLTSRAPTRKLVGSNGHGREGRFGASAQAAVANLFLSAEDGLEDAELKKRFIEACADEDLEFGLRVTALEGVGAGSLNDPIHVFKVSVADGKEERVRGLEFKPVQVRQLRRILAAGKRQYVCNYLQPVPSAVVAPAVLMEDVSLAKIEQEFDRLPILKAPASRDAS